MARHTIKIRAVDTVKEITNIGLCKEKCLSNKVSV